MSSGKSKKTPAKKSGPRMQLRTLLAIAVMLGTILAGLLILSYQPDDKGVVDHSASIPTHLQEKKISPHRTMDEPGSDSTGDGTETQHVKQLPETLLPADTLDGAYIAIIMDDLGANPDIARQVAELQTPVTMSIIPDLRYAQRCMQVAAQHGRETMIHLPMEPLNYPHHNPGKMALMLDMTEDEVKSRTAYYLDKIPLAKGCNNHMGSAFTQSPQQMETVLKLIARRGLYYVDSLTSASSVGNGVARKLNVPSATRNVFLDNERDAGKITHQLETLLRIAQKEGSAIGICHPYPETVAALNACASLIDKYKVTVVPASKLVR